MSKNDVAWQRFFEQTDILQRIQSRGFAYVTADELKQVTQREPRLMAKQDTLSVRPQLFRQHRLSIFPVQNGVYILFADPEQKTFYQFQKDDLALTIEPFRPSQDLRAFDSYPGSQRLSESQAIDFAYISSLIQTFVGIEQMYLTIRGRLFSGAFSFRLPASFWLPAGGHKVDISRVQIEVDAGYESNESICLIEAKVGKRDDFHIRQLYYPYLEWSRRSGKVIRPIFLVFSNQKYYFYEFGFSDSFGELQLVQQRCFSVDDSPNAAIDLSYLLAETAEGIEPEGIPFPQANDLDKVADLVSMSEADIITKESIADLFEFDERQGDYYANAARYIGLLEKQGSQFGLTAIGQNFRSLESAAERTRLLVTPLLMRPTFRHAFTLFQERKMDLLSIQNEELAKLIDKYTTLSGTTPMRRASTMRSWLSWVLQNGQWTHE